MTSDTCPRRDLAVGWALRALEPEEEAAFSRHLPTCAECQAQVDATTATAALLGSAVPQVDPPARLRASILAAARSTPPAAAVPAAPRHAAPAPPAPAPVDELAARRAAAPRRSRRALVAAATVLVLAVGAVAGAVGSSLGGGSTATTTQADGAASQAVVRDLADAGTRQVVLTDPGTSAPVAVLLEGADHDVVLPVDLPTTGADQRVWVWGLADSGTPVPLGDVVGSTDAGPGALGARQVDSSAVDGARDRSYGTYALSLEPSGVTPTTPTTVIASGQVRA